MFCCSTSYIILHYTKGILLHFVIIILLAIQHKQAQDFLTLFFLKRTSSHDYIGEWEKISIYLSQKRKYYYWYKLPQCVQQRVMET